MTSVKCTVEIIRDLYLPQFKHGPKLLCNLPETHEYLIFSISLLSYNATFKIMVCSYSYYYKYNLYLSGLFIVGFKEQDH